jgi:hypothetical protein
MEHSPAEPEPKAVGKHRGTEDTDLEERGTRFIGNAAMMRMIHARGELYRGGWSGKCEASKLHGEQELGSDWRAIRLGKQVVLRFILMRVCRHRA